MPKEAEEEHPEWKSLSTKDTKLPGGESARKGFQLRSSDCHYWFPLCFIVLPTTDAGTEVIKPIARSSSCQKIQQKKDLAQSPI